MAEGAHMPRRVYQNIHTTGHSANHFGDVYTNQRSRRDMLLNSLAFDGMHHPRQLEALEGTYEWIFKESNDDAHSDGDEHLDEHSEDNASSETDGSDEDVGRSEDGKGGRCRPTSFPEWARSCESLFWISGKAGFGKSTLMSFLSEHDTTQDLLQEWAGVNELVIASFFFWNAGNKMQKSQLGLMRALLYQIVDGSEDVDLEQIGIDRRTSQDSAWKRHWTRRELAKALASLIGGPSTKRRFCFFVDGLDEYELENAEEGNHDDLVEYLKTLATLPCVKLCASSRPWNVFKEAFYKLGRFQIAMHDLTSNDIKTFIRRRLQDNPHFAEMLVQNAEAMTVVDAIQRRAQGVFFWVSLAVKDVRRGLSERDDAYTLQQRIDRLPQELDDFLERIFRSIEPIYEKLAARTLLLVLLTKEPCLLVECSYIEELARNPDSAFTAKLLPLALTEVCKRVEHTKQLLNKWCKDLLDVGHRRRRFNEPKGIAEVYRVELHFAHRTISDFIRSKAEAGHLSRMAGPEYCPYLGKGSMMLHTLKSMANHGQVKYYLRYECQMCLEKCEDVSIDYFRVFQALDQTCGIQLQIEKGSEDANGDNEDYRGHWSPILLAPNGFNPTLRPLSLGADSAVSFALSWSLRSCAYRLLKSAEQTLKTSQLRYVLLIGLLGWRNLCTEPPWLSPEIDRTLVGLVMQRQRLNIDTTAFAVDSYECSLWTIFVTALSQAESWWNALTSEGGVGDMLWTMDRLLQLSPDVDATVRRNHVEDIEMYAAVGRIDSLWPQEIEFMPARRWLRRLEQHYAKYDGRGGEWPLLKEISSRLGDAARAKRKRKR